MGFREKRRIDRTLRRRTSSTPEPVPLDWEEASDQCDTIVEIIEDLENDGVVDKAPDFFESVKDKVISIQATIDRKQKVTEKQQRALDNMERGVKAWVR